MHFQGEPGCKYRGWSEAAASCACGNMRKERSQPSLLWHK